MSRSRSYCFTLHTDEAKEIKFPDNVRYAIYQYELAPTTNKLHAQGYMQINTPLSVKSASKILPGAHLEIAKGTLEDNIKYCSKTDTRLPGSNPYIFGEPLKQGQRTDLNKIHDLIKSGLTPNQIAAECPSEFVKYSTGIRKLYDALLDVPRKFKTEVIWLCGPTGSGKSFIIYLLTKHYNKKTLVIAPNIGLVHQMHSDFVSYGFDGELMHKIYSGKEKYTDHPVIVGTWQSIMKLPKEWLREFDVVIGDEVHLFSAKSLTTIMENMDETKYRFGLTGTLDKSETNKLVLTGLFGSIIQETTTAELIEKKVLAPLNIKCIILTRCARQRTSSCTIVRT